MSRNSSLQHYTQLMEWLKSKGKKPGKGIAKKSRFNSYKEKGRK